MQDIEHSIVQINFFIMKIQWHLWLDFKWYVYV